MSWISSQRKLTLAHLLFIISLSFTVQGKAQSKFEGFRFGIVGGFGGSGIAKAVDVEANGVTRTVNVSRSNGPGVYGFFIEYPLDSLKSISVERFQGFSLSPFSNGVEFTGASYKWYYMGAMPSMVKSDSNTTLMVKGYVPFVAASVGVAKGLIERQKDLVSSVDATGVYFGGHIGVDYQFAPNWIMRPDIIFGMTLPDPKEQASLSLFGITAGLVYIF